MAHAELIWHSSQFVAHETPSKARIFAIDPANESRLNAITTLDGDDAAHADRLIEALNTLVNEQVDQPLAEVLPALPQAVQLGLREYAHRQGRPEPGTFSEAYGRLALLRVLYTSSERDLLDLMAAAYLIGLGIRATNEHSASGEVGWELRLFNAEPTFDSTDELRAWSASSKHPFLSTWLSDDQPVEEGLRVALEASREGRLVRLHSCELPDETRIVVDVYDAPIPAASEN